MGCASGKSESNNEKQPKQQENVEQKSKPVQEEQKIEKIQVEEQVQQSEKPDKPAQIQLAQINLENSKQIPTSQLSKNNSGFGLDPQRPSNYFATQTPTLNGTTGQIKQIANGEKNTASLDNIRQFYKVGKVLGNGSFGAVRICHSRFEKTRKYAIKTIAKVRMGSQIHLLRRELEILKTLDHPNIIKFYEIYMDDMYIHFVMEYCAVFLNDLTIIIQGGDLYNTILTNSHFQEQEGAKVMQKIFSAVAHMHSRDLKPENILFSNDTSKNKNLSDVKIIDFGLSRQFQPQAQSTLPSVVGTPLYVAPEVIDETMYDKQCDAWSLGVVTYFVLSGKEPFYAKNIAHVYSKIKKGEFHFNAEVWKDVSENAKDLMRKLLVVDPKKRMTVGDALQHDWFNLNVKNTNDLINLDMKEIEAQAGSYKDISQSSYI